MTHKRLWIPGPTEVSEDILLAQTKPMIGHREPAEKFGLCHTCGAEVGFERLDALPHARYCIDCKVKEEEDGG